MRLRISLLLICLLFPSVVSAGVGFPAQSVWLSDTKPKVGEKIRIYAVVYNSTDAASSGTLTFLVDGKENGSKSLSLDSGESLVVASPWTATPGEHMFSARFAGTGAGTEVQLSETVAATVDAPPSAVEQTIADAKSASSQLAATSIPILTEIGNTIFGATEAIRNAGVTYLENRQVQNSPARASTVLGTSSAKQVEGFSSSNAAAAPAGIVSKITQTASSAALVAFRSLWLFYPLFVGFLLLIFRWLYKWATRPRF